MAGPEVSDLQTQSAQMRFFVVPGHGESTAKVYEDDGHTQAYDSEFAVTEVNKKTDANSVTLTVAPRKGSFKGMLDNRRISVVLESFVAPSSVKVNGVEVPYSRYAAYDQKEGKAVWGYDGTKLQTVIWLTEAPACEQVEIVCSFAEEASPEVIYGKKGLIRRMLAITPEAKYMFAQLKISDLHLPDEFLNLAQCGSYITEDPAGCAGYLKAMDVDAMNRNLATWEKLSNDFKVKAAAQAFFKKDK